MKAVRLVILFASAALGCSAVLFVASGCDDTKESSAAPAGSASAAASASASASAPASAPAIPDGGADAATDAAAVVAEPPLTPCCTALHTTMKGAPESQQFAYATAVGMCEALESSGHSRVAFEQVRATLQGLTIPVACQPPP